MRTPDRARAVLGSVLFLVVAPGVVAGLVPWLLTGWQVDGDPSWAATAAGWLLIVVGAAALLHAFARFALEGIGTPAPVAPARRLVVGGLYRHVRNPMYIAVASVIVGQALVLGRPGLLLYAVVFGALVWSFVHFYEEPTLERSFGAEYAAYRAAVPGWWPRRRPWSPPQPDPPTP